MHLSPLSLSMKPPKATALLLIKSSPLTTTVKFYYPSLCLARRRHLNNLGWFQLALTPLMGRRLLGRLCLSLRNSGSMLLPRLLRVQNGLHLRRGVKTRMVRVLLVKVVIRLEWGKVVRDGLGENQLENGVNGLLLGCVTVPNGN